MHNITAVLKEKWYLVVGALVGIWALMKLAGQASGAGASASLPAGVAVQYTGTSANDAAIQVAQLQNQSQVAAQQIAMAQAVQLGEISLKATENTNATQLGLAETQGKYALAITNNNNEAAQHASDNATTLGVVESNNAATVAVTQANDAYLLGVDTNAANLKRIENSNATQLAAYGIQASVANHQIDALNNIATTVSNNAATVQQKAIESSTQLQAERLANQSQIIADTMWLMGHGQFNKGGEGGVNQVAVWNTLTNPASASVGDASSASAANQASDQISGIITALGGAVKDGLSAVFA